MIDQPIPAKILLNLADGKVNTQRFISLSETLYKHNLIFSEPRELRQNMNVLELTVIFRDIDSYNNWLKNIKIKTYWASEFDELLINEPETIKERNVIIEFDKIKNCNCNKTEFYILQGRSMQFIDELICNNCLGQIPYSKIPLKIEIEDWQIKYERVYSNWIESGLFEKEALKELKNYKKGKLNLAGEEIRKQLSSFFKLPVYINYFHEEQDDNHPCLICGQKGVDSGLRIPSRICKNCNTIFGSNDSD